MAAIAVTRELLTVCARQYPIEPQVGMLMASSSGSAIFEIVSFTKVARAGDPRGHRYRLVCRQLRKSEVPSGSQVQPWLLAVNPPARRDRKPHRKVGSGGNSRAELRAIRAAEEKLQLERAKRVGRDTGVVDTFDLGPGIQLTKIRQRGRVLRDAAVAVERGVPDPAAPGRSVSRRARRVDHLHTLLCYRSVTQEQYDAAECLRKDVERAQRLPGGVGFAAERVDHAAVPGIPIGPLLAWRRVQAALRAIGEAERPVVVWVVLDGGTIEGYATHARIRKAAVAPLLTQGLDELGGYYFAANASRSQLERAS